MRRREFLASAIAVCGLRLRAAQSETWRTFEITTHVHVQQASGTTRVWLPTPLAVAPYQKTLGDTYEIEGGSVLMIERDGLDLLAAEWPEGPEPILTLVSRAATTPYAIDLTTPSVPPPKDFSAFSGDLRAVKLPSLDETAIKARVADLTRGAGTDLDRARAIFERVARDPVDAAEGLNMRFIALTRAAGIPARPVFGLSVAKADATSAQHDRAEVYLVGYGWTPVDVRQQRFGSWDTRWVAYNSVQDVLLPGSTSGTRRFFMHPQGETARRRIDHLNAAGFRYSITVREE